MSLNLFFTLILALNLIILFFVKPMSEKGLNRTTEVKKSEIAQVTFLNFRLFDIGKGNVLETILSGNIGEVFQNNRYVINEVELKYQNSHYAEELKSDVAFYNNKEIEVVGDVLYKRSDNTSIETDRLSYDIEHRYFYIPGDFIFKKNGSIVKGDTLLIKRDLGTINAFNIKALFNREKP